MRKKFRGRFHITPRFKKRLLDPNNHVFIYFSSGDKPWCVNIGGLEGGKWFSHGIPVAAYFAEQFEAVLFARELVQYLRKALGVPFNRDIPFQPNVKEPEEIITEEQQKCLHRHINTFRHDSFCEDCGEQF